MLRPRTSLLIFAICAALAWLLRGLRFDDPYITYRFAENLASGNGFVFNPGDIAPTLITTTPLYALVLAAIKTLGFDIPSASHWIGALSIFAAAWGLISLNTKPKASRSSQENPANKVSRYTAQKLRATWNDTFRNTGESMAESPAIAQGIAGVCLALFPLLWLTIGFETPLFIAVALWAFVCVRRGWNMTAGILGGGAIGLRGDGVIVLGIVCAAGLVLDVRPIRQRWHGLIPILAAAALTYLPLALWLTHQFGSPIPSTLLTKSAQAISGLTGFYPNTRFPEGAWILTWAYIQQGGLFLVTLVLMLIGIGALAAQTRSFGQAYFGLLLPVVWTIAHFAGYTVIGVAPYIWYYAPMVPGLCMLIGLGMAWLLRRLQSGSTRLTQRIGTWWGYIIGVSLALSLLIGDALIIRIVRNGKPPEPFAIDAKVLPETKVDVYERVGRWIAANTSITATLGVSELGVMSYYAQRHAIDFLGLTQPQHSADIRHGDFLAGLLREQPDYVALSSVNAIYDVNPQTDVWFTHMYSKVVTIADERFWGSPMTIWQRVRTPITTSISLFAGNANLGEGWQITAANSNVRLIKDTQPLLVRLQLRAGKLVGNRTLRVQPVVLEGGDGLPVNSRLIYTDRWRAGEQRWVDIIINPPPNPREGAYEIQAQWLEGGPLTRVGLLNVQPNLNDAPASQDVRLLNQSSDIGVLPIAPMVACAGSTPNLMLIWRGGNTHNRNYTVFLHLRDATNKTVAQGDGPPRNGGVLYPTSVWTTERIADTHALLIPQAVAAGEYALVVGLYDPSNDERLPIDPGLYRTPDGGVKIGALVVKSC